MRPGRFWLVGLVVTLIALYLLRSILMPFVAGMVIAYLLDPICDRMERLGISRTLATSLVIGLFLLVLALGLFLVVPLVQGRIVELLTKAPAYAQALQVRLTPVFQHIYERLPPDQIARMKDAAGGLAERAINWLLAALGALVTSGLAIANILSLIFVTPVVSFYLLRDWDRLVTRFDDLLPRASAATIHAQIDEIDRRLAGFLRGQSMVCLTLGIYYALALTLVGLDFGGVVGLLIGVLSFIPYVGSITGFVVSMGLAFAQYSTWIPIALVAGVFLVGQAIEGNYLTPKLVGERVGLHPVWVIFALFAFGALFGFLGILIAVPAAATIGVLSRFAIQSYLGSNVYRGPAPLDPPERP